MKRLLFASRSAAIRSRNSDSRSGPPARTPSTTRATGFSCGASSTSSPRATSRSASCSDFSPPQVLFSVAVGVALVAPAPDQVEEGRRELGRADPEPLPEERRRERRRELRRRLLLVLAVVCDRALAPVAEPDEADHRERREERRREGDEERQPEVVERRLDPLAVALERARVLELLGDDPLERRALLDTGAGRRVEQPSREEDAQLDELLRRDVERAQHRAVGLAADVAAHVDRMPPDPVRVEVVGRARKLDRRGQPPEPLLPLVAPDLQVHVDDVVVGDREPSQPVADRERPRGERGVVPDDPVPSVDRDVAERARLAARAELGRSARPVALLALGDVDVRDRLALAERNVPVPAGEDAVERERDPLLDRERPVRLDRDVDVRVRERERPLLRRGRAGEDERDRRGGRDGDEPPWAQKLTCGASRAAGSSSSKYCRSSKLNIPATMFVGTVSSAVSYVSTASL